MIDLRDVWLLELFQSVAAHQSMTAAAVSRDMSVSAVSEGIGRLERLLGYQVLVRSAQGCRPTRRGTELLATTTNLLQGIEPILNQLNATDRTTYRIGNMFGAYNQFITGIDVGDDEYGLTGASMPIDDPSPYLLEGHIQMALLMGPTSADHRLQRHPVFTEPRLAVLHPDRARGALGLTLAEIDTLRWPSLPPDADRIYLEPWICVDVRPGPPPRQGRAVVEPFSLRDWFHDEGGQAVFATTAPFIALFAEDPDAAVVPIVDVEDWSVDLVARADSDAPVAEVAGLISAAWSATRARDLHPDGDVVGSSQRPRQT